MTVSMMVFLVSAFYTMYYGGKLQNYIKDTNSYLYQNLGPHGRQGTSVPIIYWAFSDTSLYDEDSVIRLNLLLKLD